MPRKPGMRQLNVAVTSEQYEAVTQAASKANQEVAEFIRQWLGEGCKAQGVEYPDNLTRRGKYRREMKGLPTVYHAALYYEKIPGVAAKDTREPFYQCKRCRHAFSGKDISYACPECGYNGVRK